MVNDVRAMSIAFSKKGFRFNNQRGHIVERNSHEFQKSNLL